MRMKSYFAGSVQLAMENARRELGSEAILVTSRLAPAEAGKPRCYEVVFATDVPEKQTKPEPAPAPAGEPSRSPAASALSAPSLDAVLDEIKGLRQQIQTQLTTGWVPRPGSASSAAGNAEREILIQLIGAEVEPDLAQQLLDSARERLASRPASQLAAKEGRFADVLRAAASRRDQAAQDIRSALAASIGDALRVETGLENASEPVFIALIGPPGAGKTSAAASIAARFGPGGSKPALVLSTDNLRVAASEQLRAYAAILGLRFELAQSPRGLGQLLDEHRGHGLTLIDTPGFSSGDLNQAEALAQFLAGRPGIQKHLPAPARAADIDRIYSAYEIFRPTHLLFSRLDETTVFGPVLNLAMGRGLPVSFFGTGAGVPHDLTEANAGVIADRLLPVKTDALNLQVAA
jgi:flagellar biosynthesis protein FlhF